MKWIKIYIRLPVWNFLKILCWIFCWKFFLDEILENGRSRSLCVQYFSGIFNFFQNYSLKLSWYFRFKRDVLIKNLVFLLKNLSIFQKQNMIYSNTLRIFIYFLKKYYHNRFLRFSLFKMEYSRIDPTFILENLE